MKEDDIMPNWCFSKYAFYTNNEDKGELIRLYNNLSDIMQKPSEIKNDFEPGWLGKVAIKHGFDWEKISCRGSITHLDDYETGDSFFTLETETAWTPTDALWEAIIVQYEGVSYVYIAEEPGNEIFINTDIDGIYFQGKYLLEICGDVPIPEGWYAGKDKPDYLDIREYFESLDEFMDYFIKLTGREFSTIEEARVYLSDIFAQEHNTIANIHEFMRGGNRSQDTPA
jgi:hypothetical protein